MRPNAPKTRPRPPRSPLPRFLGVLGLAVLLGGLGVGAYWWTAIRPRLQAIDDPAGAARAQATPRKSGHLAGTVAQGLFDLAVDLPGNPLGIAIGPDAFVLANRVDPWGAIRLRRAEDDAFDAELVPIVEPTYRQNLALTAVTWNGSEWVGIADAAWFQKGNGSVFVRLDPETLQPRDTHPAPPLLGGLAWDGNGYWAATRKNTADSNEDAWLYRLDPSFAVKERLTPPAVGCQGLAWDGTRLWWADVFDDRLYALEPGDPPQVVATADLPFAYASGVAWDGRALWVAEYADNRLHRVADATRLAWLGGETPATTVAEAAPTAAAPTSSEAAPTATAAPSSDTDVERLLAALRSDDDFERMKAQSELHRLGIPKPFDRYVDSFAKEPEPDSAEVPHWEAEMRGDQIVASWEVRFGSLLVGDQQKVSAGPITLPLFARYTVSVQGGTLQKKIERTYDATPGANVMKDVVVASGLGPGTYRLDLFVHAQFVDANGTGRIFNTSAMGLEVGRR